MMKSGMCFSDSRVEGACSWMGGQPEWSCGVTSWRRERSHQVYALPRGTALRGHPRRHCHQRTHQPGSQRGRPQREVL